MRLAALNIWVKRRRPWWWYVPMRIDERFDVLRQVILDNVPDADTAFWLLRQFDKLSEQVAEKIAEAWHKGSQTGYDRGWQGGYDAGFGDGREAD